MTISVNPMGPAELERLRELPDAGLGSLRTDRGNLPLDVLDVRASISGLLVRTELTTEFVNTHDTALEATYVFPLPDRAAVTGMTMTAADRTVVAELHERSEAREEYDRAIAAGQRASIAEEERPDVFTMRVGNILPGERVAVRLRLVGPLPYEDGAATFRFPLVVAPRYVPGTPLPGPSAGDGQQQDTDAAPDASRISPPVLLPGFPNPLKLSIGVDLDPAGLELGEVRSSLHTVTEHDGTLRIAPGERANRDFVLRLAYAPGGESAVAVPDGDSADNSGDPGDGDGTYQLVVLPPDTTTPPRPKDVVLLLDRSGSMGGWKMVAARRAAARVIDTLTSADRFAVLTFDHHIERPAGLDDGLSEASDRNRYRAVEHLARADARGGTELLSPLSTGLALLSDSAGRDRVLVLVTDGQVGNEDQIVQEVRPLIGSTRVHTVGIDRAVNAGFLGRLAALGAGRSELVESEDRLDEAMEHIHRRIGAPVVTGLTITGDGITMSGGSRSPARLPGLYPGVPLVVTGRYSGASGGTLTITGRTRDDQDFRTAVTVQQRSEPAVTSLWARARLRDLEDAYAAGDHDVEQEIVRTSLRFGVLCRFTAYVAVDQRVVNEGGQGKRVTQPVELPSGWEMPAPASAAPSFLGVSASPFGAPDAMSSMPLAAPPAPPAPAPSRPGFSPVRAKTGGVQADGTQSSGSFRGGGAQSSGGHGGGAPGGGLPGTQPGGKQAGGTQAGGAQAGSAPIGGAPAGAAPRGFLAPAAARSRRTGALPIADVETTIAEIRELAAVEADRLRDGAGLPAADRRDQLDDLASRLEVLISSVVSSEVEELRKLITLLRGDTPLDEKWPAALHILGDFSTATSSTATSSTATSSTATSSTATSSTGTSKAGDSGSATSGPAPAPKQKKPFWKR
ncbi:Ca-activated chloride channel family protein [Actinoplanes lutulentus]|uniref:Ca-activated chloride channel family protein n=1 Tax=Actinoplanes lutulentus TaxID=1287878 RepID=A0A327Z8M4_9ACTN|nr:VIT domain-containing protein [Actinoplanes lutulentus]MBB2943622.1 Ca-activated chloride channel family protein [Actinoplanes lutulentus]RAK27487.1 Ca-activated chloride channel family protein [Actinoplanes lutulentus]